MSGNNSEAHSKLVHRVLLKIGTDYHHVRAWKNHSGMAYTPDSVTKAINLALEMRKGEAIKVSVPIKYGLNGAADISGIMRPHGKRVELEIKTGTGKQSDVQKAYQKMITDFGGIYIVVRDLQDLNLLSHCQLPLP